MYLRKIKPCLYEIYSSDDKGEISNLVGEFGKMSAFYKAYGFDPGLFPVKGLSNWQWVCWTYSTGYHVFNDFVSCRRYVRGLGA